MQKVSKELVEVYGDVLRPYNNKLVIEINQFAIYLFGENKHSIGEVLRRLKAVGNFPIKIEANTPEDIIYYGAKDEKVYVCSIIDARDILISKNYLSKRVANFVQHINKFRMLKFFDQLIESTNEERDKTLEYAFNNRHDKRKRINEARILAISTMFDPK